MLVLVKKILMITFLLVCIAVSLFAGWNLYRYYRVYHDGKKEYDTLEKYIEKNKSEDEGKVEKDAGAEEKDRCPIKVDFASLRKINSDVVGWIHIPGTGIDYPIVQAKDNRKYLHRTFQGKDSHVGAIFLDAACKPDFSSFNSIIYGHNLKNGEMFGHLKKQYDVIYNPKADYKKHRKIWIITPEAAREYEIFAFREINIKKDRDVYTIEPADPEEQKTFFDKQISRSQKKTHFKSTDHLKMITLSTCTSQTQDGRFVVQAVLQQH